MIINSDINVLGSLPDWNLIKIFLTEDLDSIKEKGGIHTYTAIKTDKSVKRFEKAIKSTLLKCETRKLTPVLSKAISASGINAETLMLLFWNSSFNNQLLRYLNEKVFFPAFYSGRISLRNDEIIACIRDLRQTEVDLKKWSDITIKTTASKYLTLLKKFGLMEGTMNKKMMYPNLSDSTFILFTYWLVAISEKPNIIDSEWLLYCFTEKEIFLNRLLQKKFSKFFNVVYTGDKLSVEPIIPYELIYESITKP